MAQMISRRSFFYVATPLATLLIGVAIARADLTEFKKNELLSAQTMNNNFKELDTKLNTLASKVTALETELAALKSEQVDPLCPTGYTHDEAETSFVRCTLGTPVFDEVAKVGSGAASFWIDRFEASVWENANGSGSLYGVNVDDYPIPDNAQSPTRLYALSKPGVFPSAYATWFQAQAACASSGKRLASRYEWYLAAQGTPDPGSNSASGKCLTNAGGPHLTGSGVQCRSIWGAEDMIGNLWEMTQDWEMTVGLLAPKTTDGQIVATLEIAELKLTWPTDYNQDGLWGVASGGYITGEPITPNLPSVSLHGGSYQTKQLSGVFSFAVDSAVINSINYVGFRCMIPRTR